MKNILSILLLAMMVGCWSCSDGGEDVPAPAPAPENNKIEINSSAPVVEQKGGTASISFTTHAAWTASIGSSTPWATVSPASGAAGTHTLTITTEENDTYDERNATLTIKAGNASQNVTITQKQKDALTVTSNKVEVPAEGGDFSIEAKTNVSVTYEIEESAKDWISASGSRALVTKALNFNAKANEKGENRQGNIILKGGDGLAETITIYQEGEKPTLVITSDDIIVGSEGESVKIELKSNVDYTMTLPQTDWISKEESRAISAYTHYLAIAPNETYDQRSAVVYFQSEMEDLKDSINITQLQKDAIIVAKNEYEVAPEGEKLEFTVNTNVDFEVSVSADWIKPNTASRGLVEKALSFTVEENNVSGERTGNITISYQQIKQVIKVRQKSLLSRKHREALIALYKATDGDHWKNNTNWCSDKPIYEWYGVNHALVQSSNELEKIQSEHVVSLYLSGNGLIGELPDELSILMDSCQKATYSYLGLDLSGNGIYGDIPESVINHSKWNDLGWNIISQNPYFKNFIELKDYNLKIEDKEITIMNTGVKTTVRNLFADNDFNLVYNIGAGKTCVNTDYITPEIINLHLGYHNKGFATICSFGWEETNAIGQWMETSLPGNLPEDILFSTNVGHLNGASYKPGDFYLYDNEGNLLYHLFKDYCPELGEEWYCHKIDSVLRSYLGEPEDHPIFKPEYSYTSTDYSLDGEVVTLQTASTGKGINLTFMGEAFVDKDMQAGGLYEQKMQEAMEKLFSVEPYSSMRNRFNVYAVKVISPNAEFSEYAEHRINESDSICFEYARKIPDADKNPPMVSVVYNATYWTGRSYTTMYSDGAFVGYMMDGISDVLVHEVGGHGFANLLDEYVESGLENSTLSEDEAILLDNLWKEYAWGANVDWRNDASTVKWAHFLNDSRYANEGLGLYEGAYLYGHGAYRPTENSMMRYNDSPFNAPSREQIYKRIMQYSEGEDWTYDYEEFVKFDEKNRNTASRSAINPLTEAEQKEYIKNHRPPTFIKGTWREAIKGKKPMVVPLR